MPWGVVTDREGHIKAGYRDSAWPTNIVTTADLWAAVRKNWTSGPAETKPTQNTTISLVVVNQTFPFGDLQRLTHATDRSRLCIAALLGVDDPIRGGTSLMRCWWPRAIAPSRWAKW